MRRLLFVATGAFFVIATLLPTQRAFVVSAVSDGERLAMYSKPAVVRIIDGGIGQILFAPPGMLIPRPTSPATAPRRNLPPATPTASRRSGPHQQANDRRAAQARPQSRSFSPRCATCLTRELTLTAEVNFRQSASPH